MGSPVKIENLSDGRAPSVVEHVCLLSMQIPEHGTIRVTIEDSVDIRFGTATCVGKFLNKLITVLNVTGTFFHDVLRQQVVFLGVDSHTEPFPAGSFL